MGADTISTMAESIYGRDVWGLRFACAIGILFLGFIVYALAPRQEDSNDADEVEQALRRRSDDRGKPVINDRL